MLTSVSCLVAPISTCRAPSTPHSSTPVTARRRCATGRSLRPAATRRRRLTTRPPMARRSSSSTTTGAPSLAHPWTSRPPPFGQRGLTGPLRHLLDTVKNKKMTSFTTGFEDLAPHPRWPEKNLRSSDTCTGRQLKPAALHASQPSDSPRAYRSIRTMRRRRRLHDGLQGHRDQLCVLTLPPTHARSCMHAASRATLSIGHTPRAPRLTSVHAAPTAADASPHTDLPSSTVFLQTKPGSPERKYA